MKKVLALMLALVLVLSLASCGGGENKGDTSSKATETVYKMGDTAKTDVAEVTVDEVTFEDSFNGCNSDNEHQYACVAFSFKNIGKTEIEDSSYIYEMPIVDYNNGYTFTIDEVEDPDDPNNSYSTSLLGTSDTLIDEIKPLSDEVGCVSAIYVPNEVAEKTSAPLLIKFDLPKSKGSETVAFKVR